MISLGISLAPQLGWKDPDYLDRIAQGTCLVSQDTAYQVNASEELQAAPKCLIMFANCENNRWNNNRCFKKIYMLKYIFFFTIHFARIILKRKYICMNYLADLCNLRDVLSSAPGHLIPVLEDISSGAKKDQEEARYHSSAAAWKKRHPQARHEEVIVDSLPSFFPQDSKIIF